MNIIQYIKINLTIYIIGSEEKFGDQQFTGKAIIIA
jgi:hypothetical protein